LKHLFKTIQPDIIIKVCLCRSA